MFLVYRKEGNARTPIAECYDMKTANEYLRGCISDPASYDPTRDKNRRTEDFCYYVMEPKRVFIVERYSKKIDDTKLLNVYNSFDSAERHVRRFMNGPLTVNPNGKDGKLEYHTDPTKDVVYYMVEAFLYD